MFFSEDPTESTQIRARFTGLASPPSGTRAATSQADAQTIAMQEPTSQSSFPIMPPGSLRQGVPGTPDFAFDQQHSAAPGAFIDPGAAYYMEAPGPSVPPQYSEPGEPLYVRLPGIPGKHRIDLMAMFPSVFSLFLLLTFAAPIGLSIHVGQDRQTLHWIGSYINSVVFIPAVFAFTHWLHVLKRRPSKFAVLISLLLPSLVILLLSDIVWLQSLDLANKFAASDCDSFPTKRLMELEFQVARTFYADCLTTMVSESHGNMTFASASALTRIGDCPGYDAAAGSHPDWQYLQHTETELKCGGWCDQSPAVWSFESVRDSCSSSVADVMFSKVSRCMQQTLVYTLSILTLSSVLLVSAGPQIRSMGIPW